MEKKIKMGFYRLREKKMVKTRRRWSHLNKVKRIIT
jgi:hypothetical protein